MDTAAFYHKFLHDLRTEQKKLDGILPGVIPVFDPAGAAFAAVWGDIATFLPAVLYEHYGDKTALETYYPMMKDWVDKITREDQARGQRYLFDYGNQMGDWLALDARTQQSMKGGTDDYFIGAGIYEFEYQPVEDLRCRYTKKTLFKEMLQDEKAMEVIERISPMLQQFLTSGDEEFLHESLSTLEGMFFLGFSPEMIREMTEELTLLR